MDSNSFLISLPAAPGYFQEHLDSFGLEQNVQQHVGPRNFLHRKNNAFKLIIVFEVDLEENAQLLVRNVLFLEVIILYVNTIILEK